MSNSMSHEETNQRSGSPPISQQSPRQQQQLAALEVAPSRQPTNDKRDDPQVASNQQQLNSSSLTNLAGQQQCVAVSNPDTRTHVVGELYDTERSYVESLQILVEKYMKPLKIQECNRVLIDSNLVDEIFYTIPEILKHHETFLSALQDRLSSDWDTSQVIGNVFIEAFTNQQIIDTYTAFINNWKNARQVIKLATQTKPAFERFLEAMSREHRNKLTLDALLIMPVQRIPRYELLIKELIKHTPEDHPDYGPLIEAQKQIHELALKIDRAEKEMIHQEQLKDLESLIDGHIELQHPQRNFIRYDLVTILGTSALTVAKKERVLFLFCDLLIMTSVKKKASRRSNLQTAFANSSNDLSLLEGNKFKLLLRVQLDQVEIRLANDQIHLQHQQQEQQHQLQLQQQSKLLQDRKHEIEADLCILHQIESLTHSMNIAEKSKIDETINALSNQLRQRLFSLEQSDIQAITLLNHPTQTSHDLYSAQPTTSPAPANTHSQGYDFLTMLNAQPTSSINNTGQQQQQCLNVTSTSGLVTNVSPVAGSSVTSQQEQNISLEFVISNNTSNLKDSSVDFAPNEQQAQTMTNSSDTQSGLMHPGQSLINCETLVVTFTSIDRRQAFLQAFIEAKQLRYQQQQQQRQQQQQQQQRIYSSSVTLKLAPLGSPEKRLVCNDPRRNKLQHQDNVDIRKSAILNSSSPIHGPKDDSKQTIEVASRISSAPLSQYPSSNPTIVHQISAPQSIALKTGSPLDLKDQSSSRCTSCSSNLASLETADRHRFHHHHHHHQLMHQPASHPTSLDTICCHEQHNDEHDLTLIDSQFSQLNSEHFGSANQAYEGLLNQPGDQSDYRQTTNATNSSDTFNGQELIAKTNSQKAQLISHINRTLFFKLCPKFLVALPMNFLNTPHPALQFTSSAIQPQPLPQHTNNGAEINGMNKSQAVKDASNNLWLCMSNGYVSHVALIVLRKRRSSFLVDASKSELGSVESQFHKQQYDIVPVIRSAGDICKTQINCIAQVGSVGDKSVSKQASKDSNKPVKDSRDTTISTTEATTQGYDCDNDDKRPVLEIAIKSASPPLDMKAKACSSTNSRDISSRLSESAPSRCSEDSFGREDCGGVTSASTTLLEVPAQAKQRASPVGKTSRSKVATLLAEDGKISLHNSNCHRLHNSESMRASKLHPNPLVHSQHRSFDDSAHRAGYNHHHHHHSHHHHHHHHYHHHHHPHHHQSQAHHLYSHGAYSLRHHTVPLAELRKALERQNKVFGEQTSRSGHLAPPANTPATQAHQHFSSLDLAEHGPNGLGVRKMRSSTPPAGFNASKSFRSARSLRHQASLKTSSILAKLVGSASKKSSAYLRKTGSARDNKPTEKDDNNESTDAAASHKSRQARNDNDNVSIDSNILSLTTPSASKCLLSASNSDVNQVVVSPLSSMSSLNSANSSITVNSVCASSPNRSTCDMLAHSSSATCCATSCMAQQQSSLSPSPVCGAQDDCRLRSRSATVPCRASLSRSSEPSSEGQNEVEQSLENPHGSTSYRVSDIIKDINDQLGSREASRESIDNFDSSLWLGCDDGSLIVIDCLIKDCNLCDFGQNILNCGNVHSEVKLAAAVCDICIFENKMVFVALSNGQLAIFSRTNDSDKDNDNNSWSLTNPQIFTVTANELNSTSKLCLVDDVHLWYSFGRNIFVLNVRTLKIETKIMAPTNDLSLQFTMQSMTIENMELMGNFSGVWVSFKNSHIIQFYDIKRFKLLVEINLLEAVNNMLSYGNEIIRQHKTACLKATSLLNLSNRRENYNTLFIGTSAGIILYLNMTQEQLTSIEQLDGAQVDLKPQVASLRHGHSGQVKFLHLIHIDGEKDGDELDNNNNNNNNSASVMTLTTTNEKELYLVSGGSGVDLYGPGEMQQTTYQFSSEDDSMNHLMLWQL